MGEVLYEGSEISYDSITHKNIFNLYWDNDIVSLNLQDVKVLIPILEEFVNNAQA